MKTKNQDPQEKARKQNDIDDKNEQISRHIVQKHRKIEMMKEKQRDTDGWSGEALTA